MKIAKKLILPYLIFQAIYSLYYFFIQNQNLMAVDPLNPQWSLWFLISLFCWNVMLFIFTKWKASIALTLSVVLGVLVGYIDEINNYLSLSRTFVFFPFFLLGYYLKKEHFEKIRNLKFKSTAVIVLIAIFSSLYLLPDFDYKWLFGSKPYDVLIQSHLYGGMIRLGIYCLTLLATLSILALVPRQHYFFTKWGTSSIYVYLLHGFFVKYFRNSSLVDILNQSQHIIVIVLLLVTILLIALLSSNWIRQLTEPFIELKASFYKKEIRNTVSEHR